MDLKYRYFLLILILALAACSGGQGKLKPLLTAEEGHGGIISGQPLLVDFGELQENPQVYRNEVIRVSGNFLPLELPECAPYSGPAARWALVSENLRLDVVGFDVLLGLAGEDMSLTVDGYFRQYSGPAGCGKEPPSSVVWYLEMINIVQPTALVRGPESVAALVPATTPAIDSFPEVSGEEVEDGEAAAGVESAPTSTPTSTGGSVPTATAMGNGPTPASDDSTATPDSVTMPTRIGEPTGTATPTATPGEGTTFPTPTNPPPPTETATPTLIPDDETTRAPLPTATATVSDYPPPDSSPYP